MNKLECFSLKLTCQCFCLRGSYYLGFIVTASTSLHKLFSAWQPPIECLGPPRPTSLSGGMQVGCPALSWAHRGGMQVGCPALSRAHRGGRQVACPALSRAHRGGVQVGCPALSRAQLKASAALVQGRTVAFGPLNVWLQSSFYCVQALVL